MKKEAPLSKLTAELYHQRQYHSVQPLARALSEEHVQGHHSLQTRAVQSMLVLSSRNSWPSAGMVKTYQ